MNPRLVSKIAATLAISAALTPVDAAPTIATIACSAKYHAPKNGAGGGTVVTLGPASLAIPKDAEVHLTLFDQKIKPLPEPKSGTVPLESDATGIHDFNLTLPIDKGATWTSALWYGAWDTCATLVRWTPFVPNPAAGGLRVPQPTPSGPLSGTGATGAGAGSRGPHQ